MEVDVIALTGLLPLYSRKEFRPNIFVVLPRAKVCVLMSTNTSSMKISCQFAMKYVNDAYG